MFKRIRWTWLIVLFILVSLIYYGYTYYQQRNQKPNFRTVKIELGDISETVSATGTVQPVMQVEVSSQISGIVRTINVDFNSKVKKNQLIAEIDPRTFQAMVTQAKANLESTLADEISAHASLENAKADVANMQAALLSTKANLTRTEATMENALRDYNRFKQLREQDLVSQSELDNAKTNFDISTASFNAAIAQVQSAEAQLKSSQARVRVVETQLTTARASISRAKAQLEQANINLEYTQIIAPVDGTVISKNVEVGQTVAASLQAPKLFVIAEDLTKMQIVASIDEADVGKVREGQKAVFTVDAYPGKSFEGIVRQIRFQPIDIQNVITYQGLIEVDNPNLELKPGMTANISFIVTEEENVLKVANAALRFRLDTEDDERSISDAGNGSPRASAFARGQNGADISARKRGKIYRLNPSGEPELIEIELGITDHSFTAIHSENIKVGDEIIIGYAVAERTNSNPIFSPFGGPGRGGHSVPRR